MKAETEKLQGTAWKLTSWSGVELVEKTKITLEFFEKNRLGGSGGCNRYMTGYESDSKNLKIAEAIASTQKACPEKIMQQEFNYLNALKGVEQFAMNSQGELQIFYRTEQGLGLMTFTRQPSS